MAVRGNHVYAVASPSASQGYLIVLDVTNKHDPKLVGSLGGDDSAVDLHGAEHVDVDSAAQFAYVVGSALDHLASAPLSAQQPFPVPRSLSGSLPYGARRTGSL